MEYHVIQVDYESCHLVGNHSHNYGPNDNVLYILFVENLGAHCSSGAWGSGPNGPVVDPPLRRSEGSARNDEIALVNGEN